MKRLAVLVAVMIALAGFGSIGVARADLVPNAEISVTSECCGDFEFFEGYPKEKGPYSFNRWSYTFTTSGTLTVDGVTTGISCVGETPIESTIIDTDAGTIRFWNEEVWECVTDDGDTGTLELENRGRGEFVESGVDWRARYRIVGGSGIFEGAKGGIPNDSDTGVNGAFRIVRGK